MGGIDEMYGGQGNDTYVVGQVGDTAYELKDEGIDAVLSSVSYDLTGQYIEKLTLTGDVGDQRHRQLARQCAGRQRGGQSARRDEGRRRDARRRGQRHLRRRASRRQDLSS